jgi:hypothetical protein
VTVSVHAVQGARYVAAPAGAKNTVEKMAGSVSPGSGVVVLFGGTNDRSDSILALASAATRAVRAVHSRAPKADVVLVGPLQTTTTSPAHELLNVRTTLRAAAQSTAAHWVDPISSGWLTGKPGMITADGRLTAAGERELVRRLAAAIAPFTR